MRELLTFLISLAVKAKNHVRFLVMSHCSRLRENSKARRRNGFPGGPRLAAKVFSFSRMSVRRARPAEWRPRP